MNLQELARRIERTNKKNHSKVLKFIVEKQIK